MVKLSNADDPVKVVRIPRLDILAKERPHHPNLRSNYTCDWLLKTIEPSTHGAWEGFVPEYQ